MALQKTKNVYSLPVPVESLTQVVKDNPSHIGAYTGSIDLAVPLSTAVLASADGTVTRVRDDSDQYGNSATYGQHVNYITIKHDNDELSEYLHLGKGSALVQVGRAVKRGDKIATTGLSGWLTAPHLHWMVYPVNNFQCMEIQTEQPLP